jgi:hypothetical protein
VRVLGALVVTVMIALGTLAIITQFFHRTLTQSQTLTGGVTRVVAGTDVGDIQVSTGPAGSDALLTTTRSTSFIDAVSEHSLADGVLTLTGTCSGFWPFGGSCSVDYTLEVPPGTALVLTSSVGDIRIVDSDGAVRASTSTGDVTVSGASGGPVQVSSSTGTVVMSDVRAPRVDATTSTGDVTVTFAASPEAVRAHTSVGDVRLVLPAGGPAYRITSSTSVGTADISLPTDPGAERTIELSTSVGDLTVTAR